MNLESFLRILIAVKQFFEFMFAGFIIEIWLCEYFTVINKIVSFK